MPKPLNISINALTWSILFISPLALGADHKCNDCHKTSSPGKADLVKPLSTLCADCHAARLAAGEHAVDISLSSTMDNKMALPLQNGKLTCITCHDPHKASLALRLTDPDLCQQCHNR
jgi:predicted CXXCH cytochrome family protein